MRPSWPPMLSPTMASPVPTSPSMAWPPCRGMASWCSVTGARKTDGSRRDLVNASAWAAPCISGRATGDAACRPRFEQTTAGVDPRPRLPSSAQTIFQVAASGKDGESHATGCSRIS